MMELATLPHAAGLPALVPISREIIQCIGDFHLARAGSRSAVAATLCERAVARARHRGDSRSANAARVLSMYVRALGSLAAFWRRALDGRSRRSWDALIDTETSIEALSRHVHDGGAHGLVDLADQVASVQRLFPYRLFTSMEISYTPECSICGLSPWDAACTHRPGELHLGEIAGFHLRDPRLIGLALTKHPRDKRSVMTSVDDSGLDYDGVRDFVTLANSPFIRLAIRERRVARNVAEFASLTGEACPCESGRIFDHCHRGAGQVPVILRNMVPDGVFELRPVGLLKEKNQATSVFLDVGGQSE